MGGKAIMSSDMLLGRGDASLYAVGVLKRVGGGRGW